MNYWLVKSEPFKYSWDQFVKDKTTIWDGVRNYGARNNLVAMKKGDKVFFYHSNEGLEIVGTATVTKESFQDPTTDKEAWKVVELKAGKKLKNPVPLSVLKSIPTLKDMDLVRLGRLSVQTVKPEEWEFVMKLSEEKREKSK